MEIKNMKEIPFMEFPTGRKTHVMIGQNGALTGEKFCQGFVEIFPGGTIPSHSHETVESYTILRGTGLMKVENNSQVMNEGDFIFIESNQNHCLKNIGNGILHLMFVYAPQMIVDHWEQEKNGL